MKDNKRAAMEMSVGTIVTIVLLLAVLILGIFLVQKIFSSGTNAIDTIDSEVQSQIEKLFGDADKKIAVYPTSRDITVKKGDTPKGFAFSVKNTGTPNDGTGFSYTVEAQDVSSCGSGFSIERANSYLLGGTGSFSLEAGNSLDLPRLVRFNVPESAPPCTITYALNVNRGAGSYSEAQIFVTIK